MKMDPKQTRDFEFDDGKVIQIIQFLKQARLFCARSCCPTYVYYMYSRLMYSRFDLSLSLIAPLSSLSKQSSLQL